MPELPEVEISARRLDRAVAGAEIDSALAPGVVAMKTYDPPLDALAGTTLEGVGRVGKMLVVRAGELALLMHLMSAGRLGLFEKRASLRDRTARVLVRLSDGRELRLREFGTQQRAWAKLLPASELDQEEYVATLGPDAYPAPALHEFEALVRRPRHLHGLLRDQRVIAGIGRSWVDEILWTARLSAFKKGTELDGGAVRRLHDACDEMLGGALEHYERVVGDFLPDKAPMPLQVHARQGTPCPRCGAVLEAVFFKDYVTTYCPAEQTDGRVLKDRRLSRLLR